MKKRNVLKKLKSGPILLALLIVSALIGGATIMGYFFETQTSVTTEELFLLDDLKPENYLIERTITNVVGGNVYTFDHYLNASAYIQDNVTLNFTWSGNTTVDGITPEILYNGSAITELTIFPDIDYCITERYTIDTMVMENEQFECVLTVTA